MKEKDLQKRLAKIQEKTYVKALKRIKYSTRRIKKVLTVLGFYTGKEGLP